MKRPTHFAHVAALGLALAACTAVLPTVGTAPTDPNAAPVVAAAANPAPTPEDDALSSPILSNLASLLPGQDRIVGTPTEVYTRVARGVLTCWFGAAGPLKQTHIFHAEAAPASKGGQSQIDIFAKDPTAPDPRALRAYRVVILSIDQKTKVEAENIKISEPLASRLNADVMRWASDEAGCGDAPVTAGWTASDKPAPSAKTTGKAKAEPAKR